MPLADTTLLKEALQDVRFKVDLLSPREFRVADVNEDGTDAAAPAGDAGAVVTVEAQAGITSFGPISGSVTQGGFSCAMRVAGVDATFPDDTGARFYAHTRYGDVVGTPGESGFEPGPVLLYEGYLRQANPQMVYGYPRTDFALVQAANYLQTSELSRGISWYGGNATHPAPTTLAEIIDHIMDWHSNFGPRTGHSVYLPNLSYDSYDLSAGNLYGMLKAVADNATFGEGWAYCPREGDFVISGHPNVVGAAIYSNGRSSVGDPSIHIDDRMVLHKGDGGGWRGPDMGETPRVVAQVAVTVTRADQTTLTARYPATITRPGALKAVSIRADDISWPLTLAERLYNHYNRRWPAVEVDLPLNISVNLGDIVQASVNPANNNRGIAWDAKPFVCVAVDYDVDQQAGTLFSRVTIDEVLV